MTPTQAPKPTFKTLNFKSPKIGGGLGGSNGNGKSNANGQSSGTHLGTTARGVVKMNNLTIKPPGASSKLNLKIRTPLIWTMTV
jgi:hypothetical protein